MKKVVAAVAVLALLIAAWVYWTGRAERLDPAGDPSTARSVVLVPGYGGGSGSLAGLQSILTSAGYRVETLDIGEGTGDLGGYGESLAALVAQLSQETGGAVHIVGFSAGGVIARAALDESSASQIGRIVTLGSPHDGTSIASIGATFGGAQCPTACQQLARGSEFLGSLPVAGSEDRWMSIYSPDDEVVIPVETAALSGSTVIDASSICSAATGLAHGEIPGNPVVASLVVGFLESGTVLASPAGC